MSAYAKNRNILLVEDSSDDVELMKRKFKSRNIGGKLVVAKDGKEALDYLHEREKHGENEFPWLILLDIRMPKMNGIEVLKEIKSDEILKDIPVVMLTVSTLDRDVFDSFNFGCNHYVAKSVGFEHFEDALEPIINYYLGK
ncbi:hypothetical protein BEH94_04705 [Candidatus Altiarchaeales archaeon WOR_SM1_SCG]|nr:hypothetical protein BEH94_04705 [Candidatus Altiarchaeales archaeon WOR_SM1_SCG]